MRIKKVCVCMLIIVATIFSCSVCSSPTEIKSKTDINSYDDNTYKELYNFVTTFPSRVAGADNNIKIVEYLKQRFDDIGLSTEIQGFNFIDGNGKNLNSANVVATKSAAKGKQSKGLIIIGAHYDNVGNGQGATDNGGGIATLLDIASKLSKLDILFDVKLVAFGAEEVGLNGSTYFANELQTSNKVDSTLLMINIDAILAGDELYLYGEDLPSAHQDFILDTSSKINSVVKIKAMPLNKRVTTFFVGYPNYMPYYHTGQASDSSSFKAIGIPTVFFFAGNMKSTKTFGYVESDTFEDIMHTTSDTLDVLMQKYKDVFVSRMWLVSDTVVSSITQDDGTSLYNACIKGKKQLPNKIFYQTLIPSIICLVVLIILGVFAVFYYRKLQKNAILNPTDGSNIGNKSAFTKPDENDIFSFRK